MTNTTLGLTLNATKHIYNAPLRTLHITMDHLFGDNGRWIDADWYDSSDIRVGNPETGVSVTFRKLAVWADHNASFHATHEGKVFVLTVWKDTETLRKHYNAKTGLYNGN